MVFIYTNSFLIICVHISYNNWSIWYKLLYSLLQQTTNYCTFSLFQRFFACEEWKCSKIIWHVYVWMCVGEGEAMEKKIELQEHISLGSGDMASKIFLIFSPCKKRIFLEHTCFGFDKPFHEIETTNAWLCVAL